MLQLRPTPFTSAVRGANLRSVRGAVLVSRAQKGFASDAKKAEGQKVETSEPVTSTASAGSMDDGLDALEARIKSRRARKVEAKVKVNAPVVDEVTGKAPATPQSQAESAYITFLTFLFGAVIMEGLLIAGSGFLPEDWDAFITDSLYPSYSPTVVAFLVASSLYGLYKTGKLPGMTQQ